MFDLLKSKKQIKAEAEVKRMECVEIARREYCVSQACMLNDASSENLMKLADGIYEYVYGAKQ